MQNKTKEDFDALINKLLEEGVEIIMKMKAPGVIYYDLQTGAKSNIELFFITGCTSFGYSARYDTGFVDGFTDVLYLVKAEMHGRDYLSGVWRDILVKHGVMKKTVKEVISYE